VANIAERRHETVHRDAANRLLALTGPILLDAAPDDMRVPAVGAHRRIRALQALGWPIPAMAADAAGISRSQLEWAASHPDGTIQAATYRAVGRLYDLLGMRLGPSRRTRRWAARMGHVPPLAWDDDDIDDGAAPPQLPSESGADRQERDEQIAHLTDHGRSARHIAEQVGCSSRTVQRARQRHRQETAA
jgi:hypothetical protein